MVSAWHKSIAIWECSVFLGMFRPPVNGVYVFTVYALARTDKGYVHLRKDNEILCGIWMQDNNNDNAACTAVVGASELGPLGGDGF